MHAGSQPSTRKRYIMSNDRWRGKKEVRNTRRNQKQRKTTRPPTVVEKMTATKIIITKALIIHLQRTEKRRLNSPTPLPYPNQNQNLVQLPPLGQYHPRWLCIGTNEPFREEGVCVLKLHGGTLKFLVLRLLARKEGTVLKVVEYFQLLGIGYSRVLEYTLIHEYFEIWEWSTRGNRVL